MIDQEEIILKLVQTAELHRIQLEDAYQLLREQHDEKVESTSLSIDDVCETSKHVGRVEEHRWFMETIQRLLEEQEE